MYMIHDNNISFLGRRKLARNTRPPTTPCKYCNKMGHSSSQCTAKETGTILVLHNLLQELLLLPSIPLTLVSLLRNHAPPITIQRILDHYDNFDEESEDELDKEATSSKVEQNSTDEFSFIAPTSSNIMNAREEHNHSAEDNLYPQSPLVAKPNTSSAGIILDSNA